MSSRDLQGSAQFLGQLLNTDKMNSAQTHSYLKSLRKEKPVLAKGSKGKSKRGRSQVKKQTASTQPPNIEQIDEDIQRMIRIKRAREGHPVLNEKHQDQEISAKDTDGSEITAPYNQRLMSSTPHDTPVKIAGKASVSNLLQGDVGEHALNSFEYIRNINPQKESPRPKLNEGQVDYIAHPQKLSTAARSAFTQEHLEGMRQAYMSCLTESQLRQHQANSQAPKPHTMPSAVPQPVVLSGQNPTVLYPSSHLIEPGNINLAAQIGGYNLSQNNQHGGIYHVVTSTGMPTTSGTNEYNPNYYIISGSGGGFATSHVDAGTTSTMENTKTQAPVNNVQYDTNHTNPTPVLQEQTEKDTAHFSMYSTNSMQQSDSTSVKQHIGSTGLTENDGHVAHQRTISPFKVEDPKQTTQRVSRKDMIKSALKVALDENGYLKSGPISPFKAGSRGFSACIDQGENSTEVGKGEIGLRTEEMESDVEEGDATLVESREPSRESSPRPATRQQKAKRTKDQTVGSAEKSVKSTGGTNNKAATFSENTRTITSKVNKKVQFVPSKKKGVKNVKKVASSAGGKTTSSANGGAEKTKSLKNKGKAQEGKGDSTKVNKQEENKENLHPQDPVTKEAASLDTVVNGDVPVMDMGKYTGRMKKLQHLVKELKAVPGIKLDKEGKRLLKDLTDAVQIGASDWQTDLDLALQPIRSENAQLRRKVRILTQQLKDKERDLENAEKPDPNFVASKTVRMTVVHLQMKLFNVENEAKALRATNNKLKEDIRLYLCQLEKLSGERAEMMDLFGNKNAGSGTVAMGTQIKEPERDSHTVYAELDAYKQQKQSWEQEKAGLTHDRRHLQLSLKDKEAELLNTKELVRSLQGSMSRLLEDLQGSKPCPSQSVNRLNQELQHVQTIIDNRGSLPQETDQKGSIPPHTFHPHGGNQHSRQTRSISAERPTLNANRAPEQTSIKIPQRRSVSQQREPRRESAFQTHVKNPAHRSANDLETRVQVDQRYDDEQNRWDKDVMPRTYTRSKASSRTQSNETDMAKNTGVDDGQQTKGITVTKSPRIPKTYPSEKVGLYLLDQPGFNLNKMAQSLQETPLPQRVSMSTTNPDTDASHATDYHIFPGMSPMKGSAFTKLDPFIRDVIVNKQQTGGESVNGQNRIAGGIGGGSGGYGNIPGRYGQVYLKSPSAPLFERVEAEAILEDEARRDEHSRIPVVVPMSSRTSDSRDTVSSAPTVKELLTPLADRMERFRSMTEVKKSGAMRAINFDDEAGKNEQNNAKAVEQHKTALKMGESSSGAGTTPRVDLDDTYNMDLEGDLEKLQYDVSSEDTSTFSDDPQMVTQQHIAPPSTQMNSGQTSESLNQNESRYSVTDYFKKYPHKNGVGGSSVDVDNQVIREQDGSNDDAWQNGRDVYNRLEGLNPRSDEDEGQWVDEKVIFSPNGIPMMFDDTNDEIESIEVNLDDEQIAAEFRNLRDLSEKEENVVESGASPQKHLYVGTDLDTSLSSINEGDSMGTATTTTSISSVDDRVFRQGLANLDANIARVQQSLRHKLY